MAAKFNMAALGLTLFALIQSAQADSGPFALLAAPASVDAACDHLLGIKCIRTAEEAKPENLGTGALSMRKMDYSFFDQSDTPAVRGFLLLSQKMSPQNNPYYEAEARIYKTGFAGVGMTQTDQYDKVFWDSVASDGIGFAAPDSQDVSKFVALMDQRIAAAQAAAANKAREAAAAEDKRKAEEAYRASPAFAAEQRRRSVESCKRTIASARQAIARDDKVARISGYENKVLREQAAIAIVNCQEFIAQSR
ncbi:hypothetical protein [Pandoraea sp. SD6-2]|uniref:hypothetical protein n=1 Tax=Pandoraea sp. SD6-2 TaxID=1286093 RepID=UPI00032F813A|nr:hypothetical protein [Pandoraea sp. SD6-2]EON13428.1 putative lipoprotein [Pandoraea sp. SD6-2]